MLTSIDPLYIYGPIVLVLLYNMQHVCDHNKGSADCDDLYRRYSHVIFVMPYRRKSLSTVLINIHCAPSVARHMPQKFLGVFENCLLYEKRLQVLKLSVILMIEKSFINIHDAAQMFASSQRIYLKSYS